MKLLHYNNIKTDKYYLISTTKSLSSQFKIIVAQVGGYVRRKCIPLTIHILSFTLGNLSHLIVQISTVLQAILFEENKANNYKQTLGTYILIDCIVDISKEFLSFLWYTF